jgi:hypothetical protein
MYLLLTLARSLFRRVFRYCTCAQVRRKTLQRREKTVISPLQSIVTALSTPINSAGGTATGFMTNGVHITIAKSGFAVRSRARGRMQPRPSLGSSHALLLLSCP